MAKKNNVDINTVPATGKGGRVTKEDVINFMEGKTTARPAGQVASSGAAVSASAVALPPLTGTSDRDQVKKISGMKKAMTKTMT